MRSTVSPSRILTAGLALTVNLVHSLSPRTEIADAYDFVVIGGGQAGLVIGGRLAEDKNHTVLVLESGGDGDEFRTRIDTPAYGYFQSLWQTPLNWAFNTIPQANMDDRSVFWPRGKVLGGSSAINGLYLTRPGEAEINAWQDMLGDMDGAENWGWKSFYSAMKKSETFTPPEQGIAKVADIFWNSSSHGSEGPIEVSYPGLTFPCIGQWSSSLEGIGIERSPNMYGGENWGSVISTSTINAKNWTRSYSRTGYLDPLPDNGNYDVLANAHVTRIKFDDSASSDNLTANQVEYTLDEGSTKKTVKVKKEVILAAGTVGSPAVLLHSGVGPKDVLDAAGVDVVSELPGVGQHLQDHLSVTVKWTTDKDTAGSIYYDEDDDRRSNTRFLSYVNSAIAYVNATNMYGDEIKDHEDKIMQQLEKYKPDSTDDKGVLKGYEAIYNMTATKIFNSPIGQIELLLMNSDSNGDIGITAALQHPFSHGRIYINSSDPMDYPVIDPNYLGNPADYDLLFDGLKLVRRLGETAPLSKTLKKRISPSSKVETDEEWGKWMRKQAGTEFHPSSTCAMLPRDQGGVVDAELRVYGLSNVRVADASVPPISLSTHLMASTYGLAEQASTIIREFYRPKSAQVTSGKAPPPPSSDEGTVSSDSAKDGSAHGGGDGDGDDDDSASSVSWPSLVSLLLVSAPAVALNMYF